MYTPGELNFSRPRWMTPAQDMADANLRGLEDQRGNPVIIYRGVTRPCVYSTVRDSNELQEGGKRAKVELGVTIRKSGACIVTGDENEKFTADTDKITGDNDNTPPAVGRTCIAEDGRKLRFLEVAQDPLQISWICKLGDPNR